SRSRSQALEADWTALRARAGQEPLAFLDDPEHAGLLRRTVVFVTDREIDRDTARSWRSFLDGHYAAVGAELTEVWKRTTPLRRNTGGPLSPESVAGYGRLMRQSSAFLAALDDGMALPGDRKAEHTLWRRRIAIAPTYTQVLHSFVRGLDAEEALIRRREELLPDSTLPTRRLADHIAALNGALSLDGVTESARKEIRRLIRQHRQARRQAGVTRTDAPWPTDEQIERRIETSRELRESWRMLNEAKRVDPLGALGHPEHVWIVERTVRHAADPSLDADTARKQAAYLARHFQELDAALEKARSAVRMPTAAPGWRYTDLWQYDRLRTYAARFTVHLPEELAVPGVARGKWLDWLQATPNTEEASGMLLRSIRAEDAAIRARETLLPRSALATRRLHRHMETLRAATGLGTVVEFKDPGESAWIEKRLQAWTEAREAAGVTRTDGQWLSDKAAAQRAEERALDKAWEEIRPGSYYPDILVPLDRPDHGDIVARAVALAGELESADPVRAQKWRRHVEAQLSTLAASLKVMHEEHMDDIDLRIEFHARSFINFDRLLRAQDRTEALDRILRGLPPDFRRPEFDLQAWRTLLADQFFAVGVAERFWERLGEEERVINEREAAIPGSTLATRRLAGHMAVLEALASHEMLSGEPREVIQPLLDAHRQARAEAGVTATDQGWASSPAAILDHECRRIRAVLERAETGADGKAVIYMPGIDELRPDIDRLLANPHLPAGGRRILEDCKAVIGADIRAWNELDIAMRRARSNLEEYTAILDRHRAREAEEARRRPEPPEPARRGLTGWLRRTLEPAPDPLPFWDPARIEAERLRKGKEDGTLSLADVNEEFRIWTSHNETLLKTLETWLAEDDPRRADHVDRRRMDVADLHGELAAIQRAGLDPQGKPHRIEVPNTGRAGIEDQRFDARRVKALLPDALRPEDERDREALFELARWNRAWPKQTLAAFRAFVDDAEHRRLNVSVRRLAFNLPPALAASFANLSRESIEREAKVLARQQELTRGYGRSM
ncbi:MAG: hypothetical protein OXG99_04855, partial [Alphaproteobacteria bacterium]|nr:hypothetical protein [Alphaproteobacteria bacterium]